MNATTTPSLLPEDHSADNSILGFKYQIRFALYELLRALRNSNNSDVAIDIECIDDIDIHSQGTLTKLIQTKRTATVLTNSSAPLWKTIRIWSEAISAGTIDVTSEVTFDLVSTSPSPDEKSIVGLLQASDADESRAKALSQMVTLAEKKKGQKTLGRCYQAFLSLSEEQRKYLIERISVTTNAMTFDELDAAICRLNVHGPSDKPKPFAQVLFRHWEMLVESYLREKKSTQISWDALQKVLHEIALQFQDDNLPTDFEGMLNAAIPIEIDEGRTFIRQMHAIDATLEQCKQAQRDWLKAEQLMSYWQRHLLIRPDEAISHEKRLIEECEILHQDISMGGAGTAIENGRQVFRWAILTAPHLEAMRIRHKCGEPSVVRGRFHMLADHPKLGWHPDWKSIFAPPT